jgi:maltose alpha-D-glucosyltransferase/alpha-amylase
VEILGRRTAGLHRALAKRTGDPAFDPETLTKSEAAAHAELLRADLIDTFNQLERKSFELPEPLQTVCARLLSLRQPVLDRFASAQGDELCGYKSRIHGNYHLDQILMAHSDFIITDFEGDPGLPLELRRAKQSPLKDVAAMCYSLSMAAVLTVKRHFTENRTLCDLLENRALQWQRAAIDSFLEGYRMTMAEIDSYPVEPVQWHQLLLRFQLEKILAEVGKALDGGPVALESPVLLLLDLFDQAIAGAENNNDI